MRPTQLLVATFLALSATLPAQFAPSQPSGVHAGTLLHELAGLADPIPTGPARVFSRAVSVDHGVLDEAQVGDQISLPIDPSIGLDYTIQIDHREVAAPVGELFGENWFGHFVGHAGSSIVISRCEQEISAYLRPSDDQPIFITLNPAPGGHFVRGYQNDVLRCGNDNKDPVQRQALALQLRNQNRTEQQPDQSSANTSNGSGGDSGTAWQDCCFQDPSQVSVQFVITPLAFVQVGSGTTTAQLATVLMNTASLGSTLQGYSQTFVQAGPIETWAYPELCRTLTSALSDLKDDPQVQSLRNSRSADLVAALTADLGSNCRSSTLGVAYTAVRQDLGYSVSLAPFALEVAPHEVGHNMGMQHESSSCNTYNNAWTYACNGGIRRTRMWTTVGSSVVNVFSNPAFIPTGCLPAGLANCADNIRAMKDNRQAVANYLGGNRNSSSTYGTGWPGAVATPAIGISGRSRPGEVFTVSTTSSSNASRSGAFLLGFQQLSQPTPFGGTLLNEATTAIPVTVPRSGTSIPLTTPFDRNLCGVSVYAQSVIADPGASAGISFSDGLRVTIGR